MTDPNDQPWYPARGAPIDYKPSEWATPVRKMVCVVVKIIHQNGVVPLEEYVKEIQAELAKANPVLVERYGYQLEVTVL